ncbi:MAG: metallophosphoesterase family protein [Desulfobacterales bacterium]
MRIGVLADTHLGDSPQNRDFLTRLVADVLAPVDLLLHAGDLVSPELLDLFGDCPVHAVRGNMDPAVPGVPLKKTLRVAGMTLGLIHGWGPPQGLEDRVAAEFDADKLDCLVYGHSHRPACHRRDGILFFNPGSATDRRAMAFHSVGLLEIDTTINGTIIALED